MSDPMRFQPQSLTPDRSARHFYGNELRRQREAAQLSLIQLAKVLNSSKSTLARVETAELMPPPDLSDRLDAAFGTDGLFGRLYDLAKREAHPDQYRRYMDFEARAEVIESYEPQIMPGLLQTEAYTRAFLSCQEDLSPEQVEERVAARMCRQERRRSDSPPHVWVIVDEAVLRRPMGNRECMYEQLAFLLGQVDTPHSKVQVMPFSAGGHALMGGTLILLTLPGGSTVAYEEGIRTAHLYEDQDAIRKWRRQYEVQRANALPLAESAEMIRKAMEDYEPCDTSTT